MTVKETSTEYIDQEKNISFRFNTACRVIATCEEHFELSRRSLQFLGADGRVFQKIFLTESCIHLVFINFIDQFGGEFQIEPVAKNEDDGHCNDRPGRTDVDSLRMEWAGMTDAADLDFLLQRYDFPRLLGFNLIGKIWAAPVSLETFNSRIAIMAQLGLCCGYGVDTGMGLHTHIAKVEQFSVNFGILELVGDGVKYRMVQDGIDSIWMVDIPSDDGLTILELFDRNGNRIGQIKGDNESSAQKNLARHYWYLPYHCIDRILQAFKCGEIMGFNLQSCLTDFTIQLVGSLDLWLYACDKLWFTISPFRSKNLLSTSVLTTLDVVWCLSTVCI